VGTLVTRSFKFTLVGERNIMNTTADTFTAQNTLPLAPTGMDKLRGGQLQTAKEKCIICKLHLNASDYRANRLMEYY